MPRFHTIYDATTQAVIDVPFTSQEESDRDAEEASEMTEKASREAQSNRINTARLSAIAKLNGLGLTTAEIESLITPQ